MAIVNSPFPVDKDVCVDKVTQYLTEPTSKWKATIAVIMQLKIVKEQLGKPTYPQISVDKPFNPQGLGAAT